MKADSCPANHECWLQSSGVSAVTAQLTTPYCSSKSQRKTVAALTGGVAQASSIPAETSSRIGRLIRRMSSATRVPAAMVSPTQTAAKTSVRTVTDQNSRSVRMVA